MADIGEVKAKVVVEYDGSGLEQARKDLASLGDLAGPVGEGTGSVGEALAGMNEQFAESARGAGLLGTSVGALETPLSRGATSISQWSDALGESQSVIEDTGTAIQEQLSAPLEDMSQQLIDAAPPMLAISEHAQAMATQISEVSDSFAQLQEPLAQSVPLLPQYAESLHAVGEGTNYAAENMSVFQDALQNPYPFSMIQSHLDETGQSWSDFTSSIGDNNTQMLHEMATTSGVSHQYLGGMSADAQQAAKASEQLGATWESTNMSGAAWADTMKAAGLETMNVADAAGSAEKAMGGIATAGESAGLFEGLGSLFSGGWMMGLNNLMMPMFALQMGSMVVGQLATGIYNAAAIAEGPAAHSFGTFTGVVDALGQSAQRSFQQFSESFGQNVGPALNAMNYQSQNQGNLWGDLGRITGSVGGTLLSGGEIIYGAILNSIGLGPAGGLDIAQTGMEGFRNYWAQLTGQPQPFQGPGPETQLEVYRAQQLGSQMIQDAGNAQKQAATVLAESANPTNLAANNFLTASQQYAQQMQQSYDISHPISRAELQAQAMYDNYVAQTSGGGLAYTPGSWMQTYQPPSGFDTMMKGLGDFFGGVGSGIGSWWQGLTAPGGLFAPGSGGAGQVGLGVSGPGVGGGGTLDLGAITVKASWVGQDLEHTFIGAANWVGQNLEKGFTAVAQWAEQNVIHPVVAAAQWVDQNVIHPVVAAAQWAEENLVHAATAAAQWTEENVIHPVVAMAQWAAEGLEKTFTGIAHWIGEGLEHTFTAVANWIGQNLTQTFNAVATWVGPAFASGVENFSGGVAMVGENGPELAVLPAGSSIYPTSNWSTNATLPQFASAPAQSSSPQSISINIDGRALAVAMAPYIVSDLRLVLGAR